MRLESLVAVERNPEGPRLHVLRHRTHHGFWGSLAIVFGTLWCAKDWKDRAEWFRFRRELP